MKHYTVILSLEARESLKEIFLYLKKDSPVAANYVRKTLLDIIKSLGVSPEKFAKEPLLEGSSKNYRSITKWHYKIIYRCTDRQVIVLDIIHTSRNPDIIKKIE